MQVLDCWFVKLCTNIVTALCSAYVPEFSPSPEPGRVQITLKDLCPQRSFHTTEKKSKVDGMKKAMLKNHKGLTFVGEAEKLHQMENG